jgi:DDE family transposase
MDTDPTTCCMISMPRPRCQRCQPDSRLGADVRQVDGICSPAAVRFNKGCLRSDGTRPCRSVAGNCPPPGSARSSPPWSPPATSAKPCSPRPTPRNCDWSHRSPRTPGPCATVVTRPAADPWATSPRPRAGQRCLRHHRGRADYRQRGRTVEPVFGQLTTRQHMTRFSRRGIAALISEWHLACAAHNLLKLYAHRRPR